ncbi:MAG TPA: tetratricopeptide repeat protein [Anaerolineales bacterium]
MADTTLRAYLQEIDDLVEHEQLDEAIAHCRHVLQIYPKHVETYRLLGKSYLEAKRFGDAADLFQRVLSAIPDDFVAHIGMSIVREDEGNLDASIWHMERAFETNPANPAIQQELRRLIGRRDGLEPHKVRLTRGALSRMYAHGELYPQAIAELRSALQEDPDRPDLQTLLAEMYWRTEQRTDAAEVCNRLLEKLPFCRDGLRILAAVLHAAGQVDEAAVYHRRLASLDPYAAFLETAVADPRSVEAGAVKVEKLAWNAGQPLPSGEAVRHQWTAGLGTAESKDAAPPSVPSWVSALEMPSSSPAHPRPSQEAGEPAFPTGGETPLAADIPEWMRQAGWSESAGQAVETPVSFSDEEIAGLDEGNVVPPSAAQEDLQPADLPDWLKKIAPASGPTYSGEPRTQPAAPRDLPDWLGEFAVGEGGEPAPAEPAAEAEPTRQEESGSRGFEPSRSPGETIPTWLETPPDGATETIVTWLGRHETPGEIAEPSAPEGTPAPAPEPAAAEGQIPSWITRMPATGPAEPPREEEEAGGLPSWLSGVAEAASQEDAINQADLEAMRTSAPTPAREEFEPEEERSAPAAKADAPDWLRAIVGREPSPAMAEQSVTPPRGLKRPEPEVAGETPAGAPPPAQEQAPSWMSGVGETVGAGPVHETVDESEPDWMRGLGEPEPKAGPAGLDWLSGVSEAAAAAAPADGGSAREAEPSEPEEASSQAEAAPEPPDWMKGAPSVELRAEEAEAVPPESVGQEETLIPAEPAGPSASAHAPPEWLREFTEQPQAEESEIGENLTPAEIPSWLREFGDRGPSASVEVPEAAMAPEEVPSPEFEGALDWLQESASEVAPDPTQAPAPPHAAPPAPPQLAVSEPVPDDEVFRWLEDLATRQAEQQPAAEAPASTPSAAPPTLPAPSSGAVPESADEGIEWLERLAGERGDPTPTAPAPTPMELPQPAEEAEWLSEIAAAPSAEMSTDLWDKIETQPAEPTVSEPTVEPPAMEAPPAAEPPPTVKAPPRPAPDETLQGARRPILAPPRPSIEPERSRTTPLTESEVVEWLAQTASAAKAVQSAAPMPQEAAEEETVVPVEVDPAASLATQLLEAGRAALSTGDIPAAVQAYAPVIDRGLMLDSAIEDLRRAAEARPDATVLWQTLGDAYKKSNRMPEAIKAYGKARKEEDGLEMARMALAAGDFTLAVLHYGGLIKKKRNLESVIEDLRGALDRDPRRPNVWQALGDAYMKTNRLPEAIDAYRRGMESV